jgi:hypothetical protein
MIDIVNLKQTSRRSGRIPIEVTGYGIDLWQSHVGVEFRVVQSHRICLLCVALQLGDFASKKNADNPENALSNLRRTQIPASTAVVRNSPLRYKLAN